MGHVYFTVFTLVKHGEGRGTRRYYRVAWGVPGIASVAAGGRGGGEMVRGGSTAFLRALRLITTRQIFGALCS